MIFDRGSSILELNKYLLMKSIGLKNSFHALIDSINNEQILAKFYALMKNAKESRQGQLWKALTEEEQQELLAADNEAMDDQLIIAHDEIKRKHSKWF